MMTYLSKFQMGHKYYEIVQSDTQCQSPYCSACTTPQWQAFPARRHLEATVIKINY